MANNNPLDSENILVKVDQNNLIYIDPNSVVDNDGNIRPRDVNPENLVIYANLEADIVPRSILTSTNDQNTLTSIAKGTLNFLSNQNGKDFDTSWTDAFTNNTKDNKQQLKNNLNGSNDIPVESLKNYDSSGQSFGIDNISVLIKGANAIPEVNITFIDVRGKTLFENAENSPYHAFFHIPWPIFYLTLKGYYGKAIRYRLHLIKFSTRYNDANGNFEVSTKFVGSTFAYLSDIPLKAIMNCPYMYPLENKKETIQNPQKDTKTLETTRLSKGYSILKTIYSEYIRKGLVKPDFPVVTLRELIVKAQSLDKILEREILYQKLHPDIFVGLQDFENNINTFYTQAKAWATTNLLNNFDIEQKEGKSIRCYDLKDLTKSTNEKIVGANKEGTLEYLIIQNNERLKASKLFTDELTKAASDGKTGNANFTKSKILAKLADKIDKYYRGPFDNKFQVKIDLLIEDIDEIRNVFVQQRDKLEQNIEEQMNVIVKDKTKGFGFEPTIRNIFAVILANADVYIRLMKDVHQRAFEQSETRKKILVNYSKETKGEPAIYPWPEIKKDVDNQKTRVIAYPGERNLISKLQSDDANLWPEVEFIENFIEVSTNKVDSNTEKENSISDSNKKFENDENNNNTKLISTLGYINNVIPYIDLAPSSFLYEIYERANQFTIIDSFDNSTLNELANIEFENIKKSVEGDNSLITILKNLITSYPKLEEMLLSFSPFERYPYYEDQLPTIPYLKSNLELPFEITEYNVNNKTTGDEDLTKLTENLLDYTPENHRVSIYPFNSTTYLNYLGVTEFTKEELKNNGVLSVDNSVSFIASPNTPTAWLKDGYNNLFTNKLKVNNTQAHVLNTPYFHKQLFADFTKTSSYGRYSGSAYLLLNSLPFKDLENKIDFSDAERPYELINMSTLFREVSATHFVPYHLICKWGSIYHRYKKFITEGVDILDGFLNVNSLTTPIDSARFFNDNQSGSIYTGFTASGETITFAESKDIGVHPYYDAIFHQIVNDYNHYEIFSGNTSFSQNVDAGAIILRQRKQSNNMDYWTQLVDNSKYDAEDLRFTLMPCDGANNSITKTIQIPNLVTGQQIVISAKPFSEEIQNYYKILWEDGYVNDNYENRKFPKPTDYFKSYSTTQTNNGLYAVDLEYRKVIDLIATFSPVILEEFENIFLDFSSEVFSPTDNSRKFPNVKYTKFQFLLKDLVTVKKETADDTLEINQLINTIKKRQQDNIKEISNKITSRENTLKFTLGNPKEVNYNVWHGFAELDNVNKFSYDAFFNGQLTNQNRNLIKLYLGEDLDSHYENFFIVNDVALNETNILQFRPLIQIYAGYVKNGGTNTNTAFKAYLSQNIFNYGSNNKVGAIQRKQYFLTQLIRNFSKLNLTAVTPGQKKIVLGHENDKMKVELYNFFKSFNDKWIGGNSIGQRLLLEEFLFLDKANKDIGDVLFLNIDRVLALQKQDFDKSNLYSVISILLRDTGIDMRPLPAYVNFYGTNFNNKTKVTPSKKVAKNIFGTYLDVDYQESSPKIILQLVGQTSKHLEINDKKYKFADDSFNLSNVNNNPLIITTPEVFNNVDLSKSNRVVGFEVSFGDQNQSIFKGVTLDQTSLKNNTESMVVLENLARSESGAGAYNVDISLFDYYRQASYTCDVTSMGNVMIQPTMYFYLKNIPMFRGSYLITEVSHDIRGNNFTTKFKGYRIPYASLPDPKDSFISSYRVLFDRLRTNLIQKQTLSQTGNINVTSTINSDGKTYNINIGQEAIGEDFEKIKVNKSNITEFFIPYNGYANVQTIQLVKYSYRNQPETEWLRARVFEFGSDTNNFQIKDDRKMEVISKLQKTMLWSEIKNTRKNYDFFSTSILPSKEADINKIRSATTIFVNPETKAECTVPSTISGPENNRVVTGIVDITVPDNFGIGLSYSIMRKLGLNNGSIVYFKMS